MFSWLKNLRDRIDYHGLFGWKLSYILLRPWVLIKEISYVIKWAFQRMFRGWDDTVVFSLDNYLAKMIPVWIRGIKKYKDGIPMSMFDKDIEMGKETEEDMIKACEKYDKILDDIAEGFEAWTKYDGWFFEENHDDEAKFHKAMNLFMLHFGTFWT